MSNLKQLAAKVRAIDLDKYHSGRMTESNPEQLKFLLLLRNDIATLIEQAATEAHQRCEHGFKSDDWCSACNHDRKQAATARKINTPAAEAYLTARDHLTADQVLEEIAIVDWTYTEGDTPVRRLLRIIENQRLLDSDPALASPAEPTTPGCPECNGNWPGIDGCPECGHSAAKVWGLKPATAEPTTAVAEASLREYAHAIAQDDPDEPVCRSCGESYMLHENCDPTALCDACAQKAVSLIPFAVALIDSRPAVPSVDVLAKAMHRADVAGAGGELYRAVKEADYDEAARLILAELAETEAKP
jgi:hypothetical protein